MVRASLNWIWLWLSLGLAGCASAPPVVAPPAVCTANHDGDTITVELDGRRQRVRLLAVDTAEIGQPGPWGEAARAFTAAAVVGKPVRLELGPRRRDRYGRLLAYVWAGDALLNLELVRAGLAIVYMAQAHDPHRATLEAAQAEARTARRGMWSDPAFDPASSGPWSHRHAALRAR